MTDNSDIYLSFDEQNKLKKINSISKSIRLAEKKLKTQFPILNKQNLIGLTVLTLTSLGVILNGILYTQGTIPGWVCVLGSAFYLSLLHELEHDLIHCLYFNKGRQEKLIQNFMMLVVWLLRGNIINPWYRREIHTRHHRQSGQKEDIEERLLTNGMQYNALRLLNILEPLTTTLNFARMKRECPQFSPRNVLLAAFPTVYLFAFVWWSFLLLHLLQLFAVNIDQTLLGYIDIAVIVYVLPNFIRHLAITVVSSNCHYYGDIGRGDVLKQTQVLRSWYFLPFQLFCCNFGATHAIHHFVIDQPFYVRQLVAESVYDVMYKAGVRFDDLASLRHANRYHHSER